MVLGRNSRPSVLPSLNRKTPGAATAFVSAITSVAPGKRQITRYIAKIAGYRIHLLQPAKPLSVFFIIIFLLFCAFFDLLKSAAGIPDDQAGGYFDFLK